MSKLQLTFRALDDLQNIHDSSISEWGENTALKYMQSLQDSLSLIQESPGLLRINEKISSRFKIYNVRRHYLICDIIDDEIFVLTVQHVSMNLLERLRDLEPSLDEEVKVLFKRIKSR